MDAVIVLALLISKVLEKAREMSARLFDTEPTQAQTPKQEPVPSLSEKEIQPESRISPKPAMSSEVSAYPKLLKIYKELNRQNGIIFNTEKERNALEVECDNLKGLAKLTKKGKLQSKIDCKNEEIDILKIGLSGIAKRYGFHTVHDFYKAYASAKNAYAEYRDKADKWEEIYGINKQKPQKESMHERLQNYQRENAERQTEKTSKRKDREAR